MTSEVRHGRGPSANHGTAAQAGAAGSEILRTAAALRWRAPSLTADLAHRALQDAARTGDGRLWSRAAGWYLNGRAATEDARQPALEILTGLQDWPGADRLDGPDAARLRVEIAAVAQGNGDVEQARGLMDGSGWQEPADDADELRLDRLAVLVRCGLADPGPGLAELQRSVERVGRRLVAEPAAFADLLVGSVQRSAGDQRAAAGSALRGLARLGWTPDLPEVDPTSPHLAAALFRQWITALLDGGSSRDVGAAIDALHVQQEREDSGRQGVLLALTLTRARPESPGRTAAALRALADRASNAGAPGLEAACRGTEAEVHEGVGDYREALAALRAGIAAERVDRDTGQRFRDVLARTGAGRAATGLGRSAGNAPADATLRGGPAPAGRSARDAAPGDTVSVDTAPGAAAGPAAYDSAMVAEPVSGAGSAARARPRARNGQAGTVVDRNGQAWTGVVRDRQAGTGEAPGEPVVSGDAASPSPDGGGTGGHILEWAERSWYGPGPVGRTGAAADGGAPLADALVEELRAAASGRAAGSGAASGPVGNGAAGSAADADPVGDVGGIGGPALPARGRAALDTDPADGHHPADREPAGPEPRAVRRDPWTASLPPTRPTHPEPDGRTNGRNGRGGERAANGVAGPVADASPRGTADSDRHGPEAADTPGPAVDAADGAVADAGHYTVALDLVVDDAVLQHPVASVVLREVADRAGRLVLPSGEIRPPDGDHDDGAEGSGQGRVEVVLPDADRVTALLWAKSLVGHVAGRVGRNGLPDGVLLRSRVLGASGPVADGALRPLAGPDLARDPAPPSASRAPADRGPGVAAPRAGSSAGGDRHEPVAGGGEVPAADGPPAGTTTGPAAASGDALPDATGSEGGADTAVVASAPDASGSGRHGGPVAWTAGATVRPGSGGRRRRDVADAAGSDRAGSDRAGSDRAGSDRAGSDRAGTDPAGSDRAGSDSAGSDPDVGQDLITGPAGDQGTASGPVADHPASTAGRDSATGEPGPTAGAGGEPGPTTGVTGDQGAAADPTGGTEELGGSEPVSAVPEGNGNRRATRDAARRRRAARREDRSSTATTVDGADDPAAIPDDLGLGDLLAGALAAYRDI